jgi:protein-tyrosine phosphatase
MLRGERRVHEPPGLPAQRRQLARQAFPLRLVLHDKPAVPGPPAVVGEAEEAAKALEEQRRSPDLDALSFEERVLRWEKLPKPVCRGAVQPSSQDRRTILARIFKRRSRKRLARERAAISRYALEALEEKAIVPEGATRDPRPCSMTDFEEAKLVIAMKETEDRPLIEQRVPETASRITYWHVDDIEFAHPSTALTMIDERVHELVLTLRAAASL